MSLFLKKLEIPLHPQLCGTVCTGVRCPYLRGDEAEVQLIETLGTLLCRSNLVGSRQQPSIKDVSPKSFPSPHLEASVDFPLATETGRFT